MSRTLKHFFQIYLEFVQSFFYEFLLAFLWTKCFMLSNILSYNELTIIILVTPSSYRQCKDIQTPTWMSITIFYVIFHFPLSWRNNNCPSKMNVLYRLTPLYNIFDFTNLFNEPLYLMPTRNYYCILVSV